MKMHTVLAGIALMATVGCGGPTGAPGPGQNPDTADYPKGTLGLAVGNEIADLHFLAHANALADVGTDPVSLSLADLYAMRKSGAKLLFLSGAAEWCAPCNMEADGLVNALKDPGFQDSLKNTYGGLQALQVVQVLLQNADFSPADRSTLDRWAMRHSTSYTVGIDSLGEVAKYIPASSLPESLFIKLSDMTILQYVNGYRGDADLMAALMTNLDKVR